MKARMLTLYCELPLGAKVKFNVVEYPDGQIAAYQSLTDALDAINGADYGEFLLVCGDQTYLVTAPED